MSRNNNTSFKEGSYEIIREALIEIVLDGYDGVGAELAARCLCECLPSSLVTKGELRCYVRRILFDLKVSGLIERVPDQTPIKYRPVARARVGLVDAAMRGHTATVTKLLDRGVALAAKNAALVSAVINDRAGIVRLLIESGAEVNAREPLFGRTPLMYATSRTSKGTMELLVAAGALCVQRRPKNPDGE